MKKLLVLIVSFVFVTSCKTYEDQIKFQEQGNLLSYYDEIKNQSVKDLKAIAFQMRTNRVTFEDVKSVDKILKRNNVITGFGNRMQKIVKNQEKEPVKLNEFELQLTEEFFELLDKKKDFEEVKRFLDSKVKQVIETNVLNEREKKKLLVMISSVITGGDFIKDNIDLFATNEEVGEDETIGKKVELENGKVAERRGVQFNRRCFRFGGRVFEGQRCPAYTTLMGRDRYHFKSCCRITNPYLLRLLKVIWAGALVEPTPFGEALAVGATVVIGAVVLTRYIQRATPKVRTCIEGYVACGGGWRCKRCFDLCIGAQGVWPKNCP